MKKHLMFLGVLALLVTSCSNEEGFSSNENTILPKTISYHFPDAPQDNVQISLLYSGSKIISSIDGDSQTVFTYDGNVIAKQEQFLTGLDGKSTKHLEVLYTYEKGKLKTRVKKEAFNANYSEGQFISKTVYNYISNSVIEYKVYNIHPDTKAETNSNSGVLTFENGNIIKDDQTAGTVQSTRAYHYDQKNNPFKNILGFDLLLNEISLYGKNNSINTSVSSPQSLESSTYLTDVIYNEKEYPLKYTSFTSGGKSIEYEISFTYY